MPDSRKIPMMITIYARKRVASDKSQLLAAMYAVYDTRNNEIRFPRHSLEFSIIANSEQDIHCRRIYKTIEKALSNIESVLHNTMKNKNIRVRNRYIELEHNIGNTVFTTFIEMCHNEPHHHIESWYNNTLDKQQFFSTLSQTNITNGNSGCFTKNIRCRRKNE